MVTAQDAAPAARPSARFDNGTEFATILAAERCATNVTDSVFIDPGLAVPEFRSSPNSRLQNDLPNGWQFDSLSEPKILSRAGAATTTLTVPRAPRRPDPRAVSAQQHQQITIFAVTLVPGRVNRMQLRLRPSASAPLSPTAKASPWPSTAWRSWATTASPSLPGRVLRGAGGRAAGGRLPGDGYWLVGESHRMANGPAARLYMAPNGLTRRYSTAQPYADTARCR